MTAELCLSRLTPLVLPRQHADVQNLQGVVSHDKADAEAILRRPASRMMD